MKDNLSDISTSIARLLKLMTELITRLDRLEQKQKTSAMLAKIAIGAALIGMALIFHGLKHG